MQPLPTHFILVEVSFDFAATISINIQRSSCHSVRFQAKYLTSLQIACKIARNSVILNRFQVYL